MAYYVIDRFEGRVAVVVSDDGRSFDIPSRDLPEGCREGTVLRVESEPPDWGSAVIDEREQARRLEQARDALKRLSARDSGGDVTL